MFKTLWADEGGAIVSLELILLVSLVTIMCAQSWSQMGKAWSDKLGELDKLVSALTVAIT